MRAILRPRMTTGTLMVVVACVALNLSVVFGAFDPRAQFILNGSLPTLNLLLVGILALLHRDRSRSFLIGFEVSGWAGFLVLTAVYLTWSTFAMTYYSQAYLRPTRFVYSLPAWRTPLPKRLQGVLADYRLGLLYLIHTLSVSGPELFIALLGGLAFQGLRRQVKPAGQSG
jgi:hypothetical protein